MSSDPNKLRGAFPGVRRFTVRGYAYRYQSNLLDVPGCTSKEETYQDGDIPLATDGSLCPSVVWPGALLTDEQASRIVTLVRSLDRNDEKEPTKCVFNPHHAFIFYDEGGAPVAMLLVCFECHQWLTSPAQSLSSWKDRGKAWEAPEDWGGSQTKRTRRTLATLSPFRRGHAPRFGMHRALCPIFPGGQALSPTSTSPSEIARKILSAPCVGSLVLVAATMTHRRCGGSPRREHAGGSSRQVKGGSTRK